MCDLNPLLAESDLVHRVTVDRLKWELGAPVPWLPPALSPALYNPRYYYYYYYDYPYGYPWAGAASNQYHYSQGFRDGLKSASGSGSCSGASTPPPGVARQRASETTKAAAPAVAPACGQKLTAAGKSAAYPGDLKEFPSSSYRRPLSGFPVSTDTSYDSAGWPYGCKPFYFRHADPPSVRYCWN